MRNLGSGDWPAGERYIEALTPTGRHVLRMLLSSKSEVRAYAIGLLHALDDGDLTELLILLEEKEWARQWFVERLRAAPA